MSKQISNEVSHATEDTDTDDDSMSLYSDSDDYNSEMGSDTWSLCSQERVFRYEHGRRYHSSNMEYWVPCDEQQSDQMDISHHMFRMAHGGKLFLAPITENPHRILDIGTGTGIWAMDLADMYPSAQVIGTDISPIMPAFVPPNCSFELDDACEPWTYVPASFDFIHTRMFLATIQNGGWPEFYQKVLATLKPGGWFEHCEVSVKLFCDDGTMPPDHVMARWGDIFIEGGERMGRTFKVMENMRNWIDDAGFENVGEYNRHIPLGPWGPDPQLGKWCMLHFEYGIEGWTTGLFTNRLGWTIEEVKDFVHEFRVAMHEQKTHTYINMKAVWGRKPIEYTT